MLFFQVHCLKCDVCIEANLFCLNLYYDLSLTQTTGVTVQFQSDSPLPTIGVGNLLQDCWYRCSAQIIWQCERLTGQS